MLKIPLSVWSKIYKRDLIIETNLKFHPYVSGDDMAFTLESLLKVDGIVFLNNLIAYDYCIRELPNDKSITNMVNVRFLGDLMDAYTYCSKCTLAHSNDIQNISLNLHLFYWTHTWRTSPFTKEENKLLLSKVNNLKKVHQTDLKTKLLLSSISSALETSIHISRQ